MNLQKALEKVKEQGRIVQGKYVDSDGCRCIIGHMLTDEQLQKIIKVNRNDSNINVISYLLDFKITTLMVIAQRINDQAKCVEDLEKALKEAEKELCG